MSAAESFNQYKQHRPRPINEFERVMGMTYGYDSDEYLNAVGEEVIAAAEAILRGAA